MIDQAFRDEILSRVSIAEVVGARVTWDSKKTNRAKGDFWACCPFHGEKTPSFRVDEAKGRFYCFGCHEKGSIFDFVMKTERLTFVEAVESLASRAGLAMPAADPAAAAKAARRASLSEIMERAVAVYRAQLEEPAGAAARDYLAKRGVAPSLAARFELGLATGGRDALTRRLREGGATPGQLLEAGLAVEQGGALVDRFRDRLMFPIRDARGRCAGFGGRDMTGQSPAKYLNSGEGALFSKGKLLYNLPRAREALAARPEPGAPPQRLVVVEGYMDVIALAGAGFDAAAAPLGTAVTEDQLELIWSLAPEPVLALDGDAAGQRAAQRTLEKALPLLKPGRSLQFLTLPAGQDPDDFLRAEPPTGGAQAFGALIDAAEPMVERLFRIEAARGPIDTPERQADLERRLMVAAETIADQALRKRYQFTLRGKCRALFWQLRGPGGSGGGGRPGPGPGPGPGPATLEARAAAFTGTGATVREGAFLIRALDHPQLTAQRLDSFEELEFSDPRLDNFLRALLSAVGLCSDPLSLSPEELEAAVDARLGERSCQQLRAEFGRRVVAQASARADGARAAAAFDEVLSGLLADQRVWREQSEFAGATQEAESAVCRERVLEAMRARERAAMARGDGVLDDDAAASERLKALVDEQPWIKRRNRAG